MGILEFCAWEIVVLIKITNLDILCNILETFELLFFVRL